MHICFISRRFFPAVSGMSVYAANLLRELVALGHDVTMLSDYRADPAGTRVYGGGPPPDLPGVRVIGVESAGEALAAAGAPARLHARELQAWLAPGVTGVALDDDDPLVDEWVVVLPGDDPVVFAATDLRVPDCEDGDRCFSYGVSRDPAVVQECGRLLGL